jgi:ubiquinone/menaquinone biosynthesis C-methylase UbiE
MTGAQKAYKGLAMEGPIATWYTKNTGRDLRRFTTMAQGIAQRIPRDCRVLEVAPGPGYLSIELAKRGYVVTALDISRSFVHIARDNAAAAGVQVDVQLGNASSMPLQDASFDFIVCAAAFKNFTDPVGALNEMHRVLTVGGQASIFDLRKDAGADAIETEIRGMNLSTMNAWMTRVIFRFGLLRAAYTSAQMQAMAMQSRFGCCDIASDGIGLEMRLEKTV